MRKLENILESLLFLAGTPLSIEEIAEKLNIETSEVKDAATNLVSEYKGERGIHLRVFNKKLQFVSNSRYAEDVSLILNPVKERELSNSMLETIAIIAYKQPITRLEIEDIRGVNSDYALQVLSKNNLVEVVGRKDAIGKPVLFGTTDNFLKRFKLESIDSLPDVQTLIDRITVVVQSESSQELYHRDEYAENQITFDDVDVSIQEESDSDMAETTEINSEDLPDFLQDEQNIQIIKSE